MSNITIFNVDTNNYVQSQITYQGSFLESPIPFSQMKINVYENIYPKDINDCLTTIFEENQDAIYAQITYSKKEKTLSIVSNKVLNSSKWITLENIKIDKIAILRDLKYILSVNNNPNHLISAYEIFKILDRTNCIKNLKIKEMIDLIEEKIKTIYPNASITLLDFDEEYKDTFINIKIDNQSFDFNIWPFDDELTIEDYTENETSSKIKYLIEQLSKELTSFYQEYEHKEYEYKIKIPNTSLLLWITNDGISITNDFKNEYERHLILYIGKYTKYSSIKEIYDIIKTHEIDIFDNILLSKSDNPMIETVELERKRMKDDK